MEFIIKIQKKRRKREILHRSKIVRKITTQSKQALTKMIVMRMIIILMMEKMMITEYMK